MNQVFTVEEFLKDSLNIHGLMGDMFISIFLIYYILITHGLMGANNYVKKSNIDFFSWLTPTQAAKLCEEDPQCGGFTYKVGPQCSSSIVKTFWSFFGAQASFQ